MQAHTCEELGRALADETADHVIMAHVEGGWNCTAEQLPPHTANVRRPLVLEGEGPGLLYYDVSTNMLFAGCVQCSFAGSPHVPCCGMRRQHRLCRLLLQDPDAGAGGAALVCLIA